MEAEKTSNKKWKIPVILFALTAVVFVLPSIIYMIKNKTVYNFIWMFTYFFKAPTSRMDGILNAIMFFGLISLLFLLYFILVKNHEKVFKNVKTLIIIIGIIALVFVFVIPYMSSDVYSYIANGWTAAHYGENPYYVPTGEITQRTGSLDPMFRKVANCWRFEPAIYGPLWTSICTLLSGLSFGNLDLALLIYKLANTIVHIINCLLIYKITKKKLFVVLYGLNPFLLFEAIANAHNDIYMIFFILFAIYFITKKKNIWIAVAFLAMATAVKYLAILLLPFLIIYHVREKDIKGRIKYCVLAGIEYIAILALFYSIYVRDFQVILSVLGQQEKYNRSLFFLLYYFLKDSNMNIVTTIQAIVFIAFAVFYIYTVIRLLLQKEIHFRGLIRKYHVILLIFTFIVITNFNAWYVMWLFPTIFWFRGKSIKMVLNVSYACTIANIMNFALFSEDESLGIPYVFIMVLVTVLLCFEKKKKIVQKRK